MYWVSYAHDAIGRLLCEDAPVSETQSSGATTVYEYLGHTLKVTNAENQATVYVHNALGKIRRVVDALGGETQYTYCPFGERSTVTEISAIDRNLTELV